MGDVKYQQLPTFNLKRGNAQNKHSLPTRSRADSSHGLGAGLVINCAGCMDRDPLARSNVRACGEPRVLGTPKRDESLHASHAHRVARAGPAACSWTQRYGDLTTVGLSGPVSMGFVVGRARGGEHPSVATAATPTERRGYACDP